MEELSSGAESEKKGWRLGRQSEFEKVWGAEAEQASDATPGAQARVGGCLDHTARPMPAQARQHQMRLFCSFVVVTEGVNRTVHRNRNRTDASHRESVANKKLPRVPGQLRLKRGRARLRWFGRAVRSREEGINNVWEERKLKRERRR
jgi:hypothetical protein